VFRARALSAHAGWYARQRAGVLGALGERAPSLRFVEPEGSFYVCVEVGGDSVAFAYALVERANVIAIPGAIFGAASEGWLRLSWVAPIEAFREGLARIVAQREAGVAGSCPNR
jgi:aspartate/methionine/tyrosine aminotransferase